MDLAAAIVNARRLAYDQKIIRTVAQILEPIQGRSEVTLVVKSTKESLILEISTYLGDYFIFVLEDEIKAELNSLYDSSIEGVSRRGYVTTQVIQTPGVIPILRITAR